MLTPDERKTIREALWIVFSERFDYRVLVPVIFGAQGGEVMLHLPANGGSDVDAERIISICVTSGWTSDPALLSLLLDFLVTNRGHGEFAAVRDRVAAHINPIPNRYLDLWLGPTRRPFFDRGPLRSTLRSLVEDTASPILLVHAPADTFGRTYTRELIGHVTDGGDGTTTTAPVSLSRGTGLTYSAEDLALDVMAFAKNPEDAPTRTDSSYPRAVARFICGRLLNTGSKWIIVLDGFGQELKQEVCDTIGLLAGTIPTGAFRSSLRLVLIDYPRERLPEVSQADILEETLGPASRVTQAELEPVMQAIATAREHDGRPSMAADIPVALEQVLAGVPADGKERLAQLNDQLLRFWSFEG